MNFVRYFLFLFFRCIKKKRRQPERKYAYEYEQNQKSKNERKNKAMNLFLAQNGSSITKKKMREREKMHCDRREYFTLYIYIYILNWCRFAFFWLSNKHIWREIQLVICTVKVRIRMTLMRKQFVWILKKNTIRFWDFIRLRRENTSNSIIEYLKIKLINEKKTNQFKDLLVWDLFASMLNIQHI